MKAVVLLSGGMDSYTAAALAKSEGYAELYALTLDYGQIHSRELIAAKEVAGDLGTLAHYQVQLSMPWGGSALTAPEIPIPEYNHSNSTIPATYVPLRNHIFLNIAASLAETLEITVIVAGMNVVDYSGYPDCRPAYLESQMTTWKLGTKKGVERKNQPFQILTPLLKLSKAEILKIGLRLGLNYGLTWSCYRGGTAACGHCDACGLRLKAWQHIGIPDPVPYVQSNSTRSEIQR